TGRGLGVGKVGVEALVRSPLAARLRALELDYLPPDACKKLLTAPSLSGLTWLRVEGSRKQKIDLVGLLHSATHLKNLHFLAVNDLSDEDLAVVADCGHVGGLAALSLPDGKVSEVGVEALIASPHFTCLRHLRLPRSLSFTYNTSFQNRLAARFGENV